MIARARFTALALGLVGLCCSGCAQVPVSYRSYEAADRDGIPPGLESSPQGRGESPLSLSSLPFRLPILLEARPEQPDEPGLSQGERWAGLFIGLASVAVPGGRWLHRPRAVDDAELARRGAWTRSDETARQLIVREGLSPQAFPLRRRSRVHEMMVEAGPEDDPLVLPSPSRALGALLGFDEVHTYRYLHDQGYILFHLDRPPTILSEDPDLPPPSTAEPHAPGSALRELSESIDVDLRGVPPSPPHQRSPG